MKLPIVFNDRYQLNQKLGEGGLAEVFLARDLALGRMVAVKLLRPEYTRDPAFLVRFHREAQSAASLNSRCDGQGVEWPIAGEWFTAT